MKIRRRRKQNCPLFGAGSRFYFPELDPNVAQASAVRLSTQDSGRVELLQGSVVISFPKTQIDDWPGRGRRVRPGVHESHRWQSRAK